MLWGSQIEIWNLTNNMKKLNKKHQNARFVDEKLKNKSLISNFDMWTAKYYAQASCTESTSTFQFKKIRLNLHKCMH